MRRCGLHSACNGEYVVLQLLQTNAGPYIDFKSGQCGSNDSQAQDSRVAEHPVLVQLYDQPFLPLRRLFMSATPPLIFFRNFKHSCVLDARSVRFFFSLPDDFATSSLHRICKPFLTDSSKSPWRFKSYLKGRIQRLFEKCAFYFVNVLLNAIYFIYLLQFLEV